MDARPRGTDAIPALMRVVFAYPFCGLGGVETSILNKLDALSTAGVDGRALFREAYGSGGTSLQADPRVTVGVDDESIARLVESADAVVAVDYPDLADRLERAGWAAPLVFETHASHPASVAAFHRHLDHPLVRTIVVPAEYNRRLIDPLVLSRTPVAVIPNPIDPRRFVHHEREFATEPRTAAGAHPLVGRTPRTRKEPA